MAFRVPTFPEMHEILVALLKALLPTRDVSRESFNWKFLGSFSGGVTDNHAHIDAVEKDGWPDTAEGDALEHWGRLFIGDKLAATPSRKQNALRVVGVPGSAVPLNAVLTHESGLRFKINESNTVADIGRVDVDVVSLDVGSQTRINAGEVLTFISAPVGLEETAELVLDLDEDGTDRESDGAYRNRLLSRFKDPPLGGAQIDFEQWARLTTGIAAAYVYPLRRGAGSVDVAALHAGTGTARILSAPEVAALQVDLDRRRPVASKPTRVLTVFAEPVDVEVTLLPDDAAVEFDWNDATPPEVVSYDPGARVLTLDARPTDMQAGDRLLVKHDDPLRAKGAGTPCIIESLQGAAAVVLETAPDITVVAGDVVYAGGPLVAPVRAALLAHVNALGTANPDSRRYGSWEGNLRPGAISRVAEAVEGVLEAVDKIPSVTVEASDPRYPDDATIGLLVPGRVIVRRAWSVMS